MHQWLNRLEEGAFLGFKFGILQLQSASKPTEMEAVRNRMLQGLTFIVGAVEMRVILPKTQLFIIYRSLAIAQTFSYIDFRVTGRLKRNGIYRLANVFPEQTRRMVSSLTPHQAFRQTPVVAERSFASSSRHTALNQHKMTAQRPLNPINKRLLEPVRQRPVWLSHRFSCNTGISVVYVTSLKCTRMSLKATTLRTTFRGGEWP